jgi:hypothetical protein
MRQSVPGDSFALLFLEAINSQLSVISNINGTEIDVAAEGESTVFTVPAGEGIIRIDL